MLEECHLAPSSDLAPLQISVDVSGAGVRDELEEIEKTHSWHDGHAAVEILGHHRAGEARRRLDDLQEVQLC
eukprot:scaffold754_cov248-Pinguiococcus_pyrenoidosus.AAC.6